MSQHSVRTPIALAGAAVIAATWIYLVLVRLSDWESVGASGPVLLTLAGYLLGAALLLVATLPSIPPWMLALIPAALVLSIAIEELVGSSVILLYLDSLGTVLVAVLAGPAVGTATGVLSSVV